jgi:endoglucanase Acf2
MVIPLTMGQAFMTVLYHGLTPKITTVAAVIRVKTENGVYNQGQQTDPSNYFTIELNSGDFWVLYVPTKTALVV